MMNMGCSFMNAATYRMKYARETLGHLCRFSRLIPGIDSSRYATHTAFLVAQGK
jgi:hypothetical protein